MLLRFATGGLTLLGRTCQSDCVGSLEAAGNGKRWVYLGWTPSSFRRALWLVDASLEVEYGAGIRSLMIRRPSGLGLLGGDRFRRDIT